VRLDDKARRVRGKGTIKVAAEENPLRFLVSHYDEPDSAAHAATADT
jgi:hypothetical protein